MEAGIFQWDKKSTDFSLLPGQPIPLDLIFLGARKARRLKSEETRREKKNNSPVILYIHKTFLNLFSIDCSQWGEETQLLKD